MAVFTGTDSHFCREHRWSHISAHELFVSYVARSEEYVTSSMVLEHLVPGTGIGWHCFECCTNISSGTWLPGNEIAI